MTTPIATSTVTLGSLVFGALEASGVAWVVNDLQGWGSPASTMQVTQKPRSHGGWAGPGYLPARTLSITGTVDAPSTAALSDAIDRLSAAATLTDTTLTVNEAGRARTMTVRRQGEVLVSMTSALAATWSVQLVALDPRRYGPMVSQSTGLPSSSGGLTWPITFPVTWTGVTNTGIVSIPNAGNITAPVLIRIDGPVPGFSISHIGSGQLAVLSSSQALAAGEFVTIDMENRKVLAQGQASRAGYLTSRGWFGHEPGPNQYAFNTPGAYNPTALMTIIVPTSAWS